MSFPANSSTMLIGVAISASIVPRSHSRATTSAVSSVAIIVITMAMDAGPIAARLSNSALNQKRGSSDKPLATGTAPVTTAAGRLFDAAAGLLGVSERASFEGEPPMRLEALATKPLALDGGYTLDDGVLDLDLQRPIRGDLLGGLAEGRDVRARGLGDDALALGG